MTQELNESIPNEQVDLIDMLRLINPKDIINADPRITIECATRYLVDLITEVEQTYEAIRLGKQSGEYYGGGIETVILGPKAPIHKAVLKQIESKGEPTNYIPRERLIRDSETNEIIAIIQYRELRGLKDFESDNGDTYAWYLRRIAPTGERYITLQGKRYRSDKSDHLILCKVIN